MPLHSLDLLRAPAQALHTVCVQVEWRQLAHATDEPHTELLQTAAESEGFCNAVTRTQAGALYYTI